MRVRGGSARARQVSYTINKIWLLLLEIIKIYNLSAADVCVQAANFLTNCYIVFPWFTKRDKRRRRIRVVIRRGTSVSLFKNTHRTHTYFPRHTHTHTPVSAFTPTRGTCKLDLQLQQAQELAKYFAVSAIVSRICILYLRISMPRRVSLAALGQFKHFGKFSGIFRQRQRHFVLCI